MQPRNIERFKDRCKMICGAVKDDCYINNKHHIKCIADLVINKTMGITMILKSSLNVRDDQFMKDAVKESLANTAELSNWIQYLQIVPDLHTLSTLVLDSVGDERRGEIRYPVSEEHSGRLIVLVDEGKAGADLVNFSQSGLQMRSPVEVKKGAVIDCVLTAKVKDPRREAFKLAVMYCAPDGDGFICGGKIQQLRGEEVFNFFGYVHQFLVDIEMDSI